MRLHGPRLVVCAFVSVLTSSAGYAYELGTHALATLKAFQASQVGDASQAVVRRLGIDVNVNDPGTLERPFGELYYDSGVARRTDLAGNDGRTMFEQLLMPRNELQFNRQSDHLKIAGWLMRGAIREDDYPSKLLIASPNPQDDPFDTGARPYNHFFDPYLDRPLTIFSFEKGKRAPDWMSGATNAFTAPETADATRRNHFSLVDAKENLFRALTLKRRNDDGSFSDLFGGNGTPGVRDVERKRYWASTFRSLGDVLHLVQDMAQPQHTRNDPHSGVGPAVVERFALGHASVFEHYVDARAAGTAAFKIDIGVTDKTVSIGTPRPLTLAGHPVPRFTRYSSYFSSAPGPDSQSGSGLADFSNREFFSAGRMFGDTTYPQPPSNLNSYGQPAPVDPIGWDGQPISNPVGANGKIRVYTRSLNDFQTGTPVPDVPAFTRSVWDQFLERRSILPTYTLNHIVYDAHANQLLPRAVAYSAGLLDYFFRGTMQISLPADGVYAIADHSQFNAGNPASGFTKIKLKLANTTPAIGTGPNAAQDMTGGKLVAVVKFRRNGNYASDLSKECGSPGESLATCRGTLEEIVVSTSVTDAQGEPVTSATLVAGAAPQEFQFTFSDALPLNVTDVYLQVVYRGALGSEGDAVVVATKNIPEPTFLSIFNATDSTMCVNGTWVKLNTDGSVPEPYYSQIVTAGGNPASLTLNTFSRIGLTFKPPFTYPLSANSPPVTALSVAPGRFIRVAALTDDLVPFDYDIEGLRFYDPQPFITEWNGIDYDGGTPTSYTSSMKVFRGVNTFNYRFGYRFFGGDCDTNSAWPTDSASANGGSYATPTLVPINTLAF